MSQVVDVARRLGSNLARAARRGLAHASLPRDGGMWIEVRLAPPLGDLPAPRLPFAREGGASLLEVLETLETAGTDPQVAGVMLVLAGAPSGWSRVESLRRAVLRFRESGKPVVAYAEVLDAESLAVASAASKIWLPATGNVFLVGLRLEAVYLRGLLDLVHVKPEVIRIGSHKSGGERFTRDHMSSEEREQLEFLADDLYDVLVGAIAAGRKLEPATVKDLVDRGPYTARAAVEAGLVDGCCYADEVEQKLEALTPIPPGDRPGPRRVRMVQGAVYHALRAADPGWRPLLTGLPRIAYVVADGAIQRGAGTRGIASERMSALLDGIRREEGIRGVVLRLDSPGGDGLASDILWRAVSLLTREKPVVVSMGDVVASGGYYMAVAADALFAEASTVTGSIGVFGGKVNLEGLYRRLGVGKDAVERGARAGLLSEARGFTPAERGAVRAEMSALYEAFVDRVARGRGIVPADLDKVAQGRVWSGARARSLGLVDSLGGPLEALREVRRRAGLAEGEGVLVEVHPRLSRLPGPRALLRLVPGSLVLP